MQSSSGTLENRSLTLWLPSRLENALLIAAQDSAHSWVSAFLAQTTAMLAQKTFATRAMQALSQQQETLAPLIARFLSLAAPCVISLASPMQAALNATLRPLLLLSFSIRMSAEQFAQPCSSETLKPLVLDAE